MNGAAEAILEELLAQSRTQTQLLQQLARNFSGAGGSGAGGGSAAGVAASFNSINVASKVVQMGFTMLSNVVSTVFKLFGAAVGIVTNVIQAFDQLGKTALTTGAKLSDFFKALESVPILGKFFGFFSSLVTNQERLLESYRGLARSGATFSGNLIDLVNAAAKTSLTLGQLQNVVSENRQAFAMLGAGNVQVGFDKFISAQNRLMGDGSPYRKAILGLGITAEEAAGFLGTVITTQGVMTRDRQINEAQLARQTNDYITQLDALTRLTGIQKEELDAQMKKAQNDQLFQQYLDTLTPLQREVINEQLAAASVLGEDAVTEFKARVRGVDVPITEFGRNMTAFSGQLFMDGPKIRASFKNATEATDGTADMLRILEPGLRGLMTNVGSLGPEAQTLIPQLQGLGAAFGLGRKITEKSFDEILKEITKNQKDAAAGTAAQQAIMQQRSQELGLRIAAISNTIQGALAPIILTVTDSMFKFSGGLISTIESLVKSDGFQQTIVKVAKWFESAFKEISAAFDPNKGGGVQKGLSTMFDILGEAASTIWNVVKDPLINAFTKLIDWLKPYFMDFLDFVGDKIAEKLNPFTSEKDIKENELERQMNSAARHMEYLNNQMRSLPAGEQRSELLSEFRARNREYGAAMKELYGENDERFLAWRARSIEQARSTVELRGSQSRHSGTIGMTGSWWEKESGPINVQAGETVLTQSQLAQIVDTAGSNKLAAQVERLNSLTAEMLIHLRATAENTAKTHRAAKALSGNLFAPV